LPIRLYFFSFFLHQVSQSVISVFELQKSFNGRCIKKRALIDMNTEGESLRKILDDILVEYVSEGMKFMDSSLSEEVRELVKSKLADVLLERLKLRVFDKLEASKEIEREFEAAVYRTWKKPLDLLDVLLDICLEVASGGALDFGSEKSVKQSYVQKALARQQANACLIFNEIVHLLKSGFPSGANSHWRALHEIVCMSYFISNHGEDMARRFLDYEDVESYFQAEAIYKHQQQMGCTYISESDFKALEKKITKMEKIYGSDFVKKSNYPYGWIPRTVLKTQSLREIEKVAKLGMLRPFYDLASFNVYGGSKGLIFKLGIMAKRNERVVFPLGPSNYGLADPGKIAAISLGQVTACLLLAGSGVKRLVVVEALRNMVDEICDAFCEIQADFTKT